MSQTEQEKRDVEALRVAIERVQVTAFQNSKAAQNHGRNDVEAPIFLLGMAYLAMTRNFGIPDVVALETIQRIAQVSARHDPGHTTARPN